MRHINFFQAIRLNAEMFLAFKVQLEVTNVLLTRGNTLHRKRIYLQKK